MGQNDGNGRDGNEQPPQGEREHLRQQQDPPQRVFHDTKFHEIHIPEGPELNIDDDSASGIPPTFCLGEPASVRMAYLQAVYNNVANHMPVRATTQSLNMTLDIIEATGTLPDVPAPARTLATAKRRLGIDPDALIIQYAICPKCWKHHTPEQMGALESPKCATLNCSGEIYEEFQDSSGNTKRRAIKIMPQVSLIHSLHCLVCRKGFRKLLLKTDTPENRNDDDTFVMTDMHDGSIWHELKTGIQREVGNLGSVRDMPITEGSERKVTENAFGLVLPVNLDWFGAFNGRPHSTGPWYISINNLKRNVRFLQTWIPCIGITPGPTEPNGDQILHIMEPMVQDCVLLKQGIEMEMYDEDDDKIVNKIVYADVACTNCDTPAARKIGGHAGHSADINPCPWCWCTQLDVNKVAGYYREGFVERNDFDMLKQKFYAKDAPTQCQSTILKNHGVRFSVFDWLPGWQPSKQTALDFMHCMYLGIVAFLFTRILFAAHMFSGANGQDSSKQRFEDIINRIQWPTHITCLPKNLGKNQSLKKADEWRCLLTVTPIVLWYAWRDADDSIPDTEPAVSPNENITTPHSCKRLSLYSPILFLCMSVRLLATKQVSMAQAFTGQTYFAHYCVAMIGLGVILTINHHLAMHFADMIKRFEPVYAWWLFAFERFNGMLEKVKNNSHDGGRVELTLLWNWVQSHLLYGYLQALPADASDAERNLVDLIIKAEASKVKGSVMTEMAIFRSEVSDDRLSLPKRISKSYINLHSLSYGVLGPTGENIYTLLLHHSQGIWPDLQLRRELSGEEGLSFVGSRVARRISYVRKDGLRYGSKSNKRSQADTFTFIERGQVRVPVRIEDLLVIHIPDTNKKPHVCAVVHFLQSNPTLPQMPWEAYTTVLGIYVSYAEDLSPLAVIPATDIDCPLALIPVYHFMSQQDLWISISFDHASTAFLLQ
ncbi:hypothetical protein BT96DRAFT_837285 [Gymnopus androsaceus JB14]|uniref:Uncharacterized protein n=1 Tax=Gymnopus androsaceus JB14 TaxID=1447944 RepID=A0A6A4GQT3_9AGAR|nr:hypothetical protein BT96DRAFT_837285 [Gymnopus androsaceus JB14]